jgi:hypothetical protein
MSLIGGVKASFLNGLLNDPSHSTKGHRQCWLIGRAMDQAGGPRPGKEERRQQGHAFLTLEESARCYEVSDFVGAHPGN